MSARRLTVSLLLAASILLAVAASTAASPPIVRGVGAQPAAGPDSQACLGCHSAPGQTVTLPSGEPLSISVDSQVLEQSVHGEEGLACLDCHPGNAQIPHPPVTAQTRRDYVLQRYTACAECHADKYQATLDSVHQVALAGGNLQAAVCTDCHGAHDVKRISQAPRTAIPQTCERCHSAIYAQYRNSVHGAALIGDGNPDVPTCIDCHGVHSVQGPSTGPFRLFSPTICATCHADTELMSKYGLSTDILNTYVADFHGTTVLLFEKIAPDQETNKPVCIDCHGIHDITRVRAPGSRVMQANLVKVCQRCHPDATERFPAAWLSHYEPSWKRAPIVYAVTVFYRIFIPFVIGGLVLQILLHLWRVVVNR